MNFRHSLTTGPNRAVSAISDKSNTTDSYIVFCDSPNCDINSRLFCRYKEKTYNDSK